MITKRIKIGYVEFDVMIGDKFFLRLRGLIGRKLENNCGFLLVPCSQIHTFFMGYSIDVLYLSKEYEVVKIEQNLPKNKIFKRVKGAKKVLELNCGATKKANIKIGDKLKFV